MWTATYRRRLVLVLVVVVGCLLLIFALVAVQDVRQSPEPSRQSPRPPFGCVGAPTAKTGAWTAVGASLPRAHVPPWVCAHRVGARQPPASLDVAELATHAHAQDSEDVYAATHFFYGRTGGMILETGALDGIRFSTSYLFETGFGWHAVHVEAAPGSYVSLLKNRPDSLNIHAALCAIPRMVHYVRVRSGRNAATSGIYEFMSGARGSL